MLYYNMTKSYYHIYKTLAQAPQYSGLGWPSMTAASRFEGSSGLEGNPLL